MCTYSLSHLSDRALLRDLAALVAADRDTNGTVAPGGLVKLAAEAAYLGTDEQLVYLSLGSGTDVY